jgi:hypothetical protein
VSRIRLLVGESLDDQAGDGPLLDHVEARHVRVGIARPPHDRHVRSGPAKTRAWQELDVVEDQNFLVEAEMALQDIGEIEADAAVRSSLHPLVPVLRIEKVLRRQR